MFLKRVFYTSASILMLAEGLKKTLVETGSRENVLLIRKAANAEVQSGIDRSLASIVETQPEIATGPDGLVWVGTYQGLNSLRRPEGTLLLERRGHSVHPERLPGGNVTDGEASLKGFSTSRRADPAAPRSATWRWPRAPATASAPRSGGRP